MSKHKNIKSLLRKLTTLTVYTKSLRKPGVNQTNNMFG